MKYLLLLFFSPPGIAAAGFPACGTRLGSVANHLHCSGRVIRWAEFDSLRSVGGTLQRLCGGTLSAHCKEVLLRSMKVFARMRLASSRVAAALLIAALSLRHSQTALGAYYRQIARRI